MSVERKEHEPKMTLSTSQVLDAWVRQEGNRYENLLVERGFLRDEDRGDMAATHEATRRWRETYVGDLGIEDAEWSQESIENPGVVVQDWLLGGWRGWLGYRPPEENVTRFRDVVRAILEQRPGIPKHHLEDIPRLAERIGEVLPQGKIFVLRCGECTAVLEGTHRMTGLVYAKETSLQTPERMTNVYQCELPEEKRQLFEAFCENRAVKYGPYYQEKHQQ